jgi:hypothetical protein
LIGSAATIALNSRPLHRGSEQEVDDANDPEPTAVLRFLQRKMTVDLHFAGRKSLL